MEQWFANLNTSASFCELELLASRHVREKLKRAFTIRFDHTNKPNIYMVPDPRLQQFDTSVSNAAAFSRLLPDLKVCRTTEQAGS